MEGYKYKIPKWLFYRTHKNKQHRFIKHPFENKLLNNN